MEYPIKLVREDGLQRKHRSATRRPTSLWGVAKSFPTLRFTFREWPGELVLRE